MQNLQPKTEQDLEAGQEFDWDEESQKEDTAPQQNIPNQSNLNREAVLRKLHMMREAKQNQEQQNPQNENLDLNQNNTEKVEPPKSEPSEIIEKDCFDNTEEIYSKLNWENLLFFKSACLFTQATLYEDDYLEIEVKTQNLNTSTSDEMVVLLTYICKTPKNMTLLCKVQEHHAINSFPDKVMHIFDNDKRKVNHEVVVKKN